MKSLMGLMTGTIFGISPRRGHNDRPQAKRPNPTRHFSFLLQPICAEFDQEL